MGRSILRHLLALFFPRLCVHCGEHAAMDGWALCAVCFEHVERKALFELCRGCGRSRCSCDAIAFHGRILPLFESRGAMASVIREYQRRQCPVSGKTIAYCVRAALDEELFQFEGVSKRDGHFIQSFVSSGRHGAEVAFTLALTAEEERLLHVFTAAELALTVIDQR